MTAFRTPKDAIPPLGWTQLPGGAVFVAASPDGSIWVLSSVGSGLDRSIWHYANGQWANVPGAAMRIAIAPDGSPWVINSAGGIYHYDGTTFNGIAGGASDISVGPDGSVYVISNQGGGQFGRGIWHYLNGSWSQMPGAAIRIAASWDTSSYPSGVVPGGVWVVNAFNTMYYFVPNSGFMQMPGAVAEIAPTINGGVFGLGYIRNSDGSYPIFYNDLVTGTWGQQPGAAISLSSNGTNLYAVGVAGGIYTATIDQGGLGGGGRPSDLPTPMWWSGDCDVGNNSGSARLGGSFRGVPACGPRPIITGQDGKKTFFTGTGSSNAELEWQCVELSMRFMWLAYKIPPYGADGFDIASSYKGTLLYPVLQNNGSGPLPVAGDILQYGDGKSKRPCTDSNVCNSGHTSVVSGTSIDANGNGTIWVIEQNNHGDGTNSIVVKNGVLLKESLNPSISTVPYGVTGWLHQPGTNTVVNPNPVPAVTSLSPTPMTANGQQQTLTITGSSFAAGDMVQFKWGQGQGANVWNASNGVPKVVSGTQITVVMNPGTVQDVIYVRVCSSGAATSCSDGNANIAVTPPNIGGPTVSSVSPTSMTANGQQQTLTINGASFTSGNIVQFNWGQGLGSNSWNTSNSTPQVTSSSQISVAMNPGTVNDTIYVRVCADSTATSCSDGTKSVVVTTSGGGGGAPTVSSVSPTSMTANGQTQTLTIFGSSFASGDIVQYKYTQGAGANSWNTSNATPSILNSGQISVGLNPGTVSDTFQVRVCSSSAATSCSDGNATVSVSPTVATPSVSSVSPTSMTANGQTQTLTIFGSSFASGDIVQYKYTQGAGANTWNTSNATPSILNSGQISVGLNPGTVSDTFQVRVCSSSAATNCSDGNATVSVSPAALTPSVSSVSPTSMTANGQTQTLTIFGSSFASGDIVQYKYTQGAGANTWNTSNATPSILSSGQISVGLNPGTVSDTFQVRVCSSSAATNCSDGNATVSVSPAVVTPSVSSVSPTSITANGQTQTITIFGSSFASGDIVQFKYTQGSGANTWHTSNATPSIVNSGQISVGLNPGTVSDTFQVRVCSSSAATNCSDGNASVSAH